MSGSWAASMVAAFAAAVARPGWWVLALAAFLIRGGLLLVFLPLVSLPSASALATTFAPSIEAFALSRQSLEGTFLGTIAISVVVGALGLAGCAGAWLDLALLGEASSSDELDGLWTGRPTSIWRALGLRLVAHLPTFVALGYGAVRMVVATYQELLSPGDPAVPIALRAIGRAPDAVVVVIVAWLLGEAIGGLAARRWMDGMTTAQALRTSIRELAAGRGLATFVLTNFVVLGGVVLLLAVVGRAVDRVRDDLIVAVDPITLAAALLLLASVWVLGLALLGAALAWRATAWTLEAARVRRVIEVREGARPEESPVT